MGEAISISIGIKAFNEENHIAESIKSALAVLSQFKGEVIVADCASQDRTSDIASSFPITVVRLRNPAERSCGVGAQLAFQHASGRFFYLMDGDMQLEPHFVKTAIDYLSNHDDVAGVGGMVTEKVIANMEFEIRADPNKRQYGEVDRLDGGGLYRVSALREVGYLSDRNLHAFEEFELGLRLRLKGWKLVRLREPAVNHFAHNSGSYSLLLKRFATGRTFASAEVLRASLEGGRCLALMRNFETVQQVSLVILWWLALLALGLWAPGPIKGVGLALAIASPVVLLSLRRRSINRGLYSFLSWQLNALGFCMGLCARRSSPVQPIECDVICASPRDGQI